MANSISNLTLAGILHAGSDFEEWAARMSALMRLSGLEDYTRENVEFIPRRRRGNAARLKQGIGMLLSSHFVSEALVARIPQSLKGHPLFIWPALESQSQPFRFKDLPAELRIGVYEYALKDGCDRKYALTRWDRDHGIQTQHRTAVHALSQVSQLIRHESLPIYWANTNASFITPPKMKLSSVKKGAISNEIIAWKNTHATHVKYLTHCSLSIHSELPDIRSRTDFLQTFRFSFNKNDGLRVECDEGLENLAPASLAKLNEFVAGIEADRRANELSGECLLLVLLSEPKLWRVGALEWLV